MKPNKIIILLALIALPAIFLAGCGGGSFGPDGFEMNTDDKKTDEVRQNDSAVEETGTEHLIGINTPTGLPSEEPEPGELRPVDTYTDLLAAYLANEKPDWDNASDLTRYYHIHFDSEESVSITTFEDEGHTIVKDEAVRMAFTISRYSETNCLIDVWETAYYLAIQNCADFDNLRITLYNRAITMGKPTYTIDRSAAPQKLPSSRSSSYDEDDLRRWLAPQSKAEYRSSHVSAIINGIR